MDIFKVGIKDDGTYIFECDHHTELANMIEKMRQKLGNTFCVLLEKINGLEI